MSKNVKYIILAVLLLALVFIIVFGETVGVDIQLGSIMASIAAGFAAFKAKLFGPNQSVQEQIQTVETEHRKKRENWDLLKEEFDSKYNALKARMDYLDYKSALIAREIKDLDEVERQAIEDNHNLTDEEILERLRNF